jgi:hypothetical protein
LKRHPGESRDPGFIQKNWIPAFAGMTNSRGFQLFTISSIFDHWKGVTETLH